MIQIFPLRCTVHFISIRICFVFWEWFFDSFFFHFVPIHACKYQRKDCQRQYGAKIRDVDGFLIRHLFVCSNINNNINFQIQKNRSSLGEHCMRSSIRISALSHPNHFVWRTFYCILLIFLPRFSSFLTTCRFLFLAICWCFCVCLFLVADQDWWWLKSD